MHFIKHQDLTPTRAVRLFCSALFICLLFPKQTMAESFDEWDWGSSHNLFIKKSLNDNWSILSRSLFSTRDHFDDTFFGTADLGLGYAFSKNVRMSAAYRQAWFRPADDWLIEHRPLINLSLFDSFNDFKVTNRSRFEFRFFDYDKNDEIRLRNETRIEAPWSFTKLHLHPYFEEEWFVRLNDGELNMNWVTFGLFCKPFKKVKLKAGYRWLTQKRNGEWDHRHVFVTGLNFYL